MVPKHIRIVWHRMLSFVVQVLFKEPELQIWQKRHRNGTVYWYAYDPKSDRGAYMYTEDEMRIWIDQLPYYRPVR